MTAFDSQNIEVKLAEYNTLRSEILQKIEQNNQLLAFTFTAIIAVLAFAVEAGNLFLYIAPMMIIIPLSIRIAYYKSAIVRLSAYIIVYLEGQINELAWESRNCSLSQMNVFNKSIFTNLFEHECLILSLICFLCYLQALLTSSSDCCIKIMLTICALVLIIVEFIISFNVKTTNKERIKWIDIWTLYKLQNSSAKT